MTIMLKSNKTPGYGDISYNVIKKKNASRVCVNL